MREFKLVLLAIIFLGGCRDLDISPIDEDVLPAGNFFGTEETYAQGLAKIYSALVLTGNQGPSGDGDLKGIDEGFSSYLRMLYYLQEFPTDESVVGWGDVGIRDFQNMNWDANNPFITGLFYRLYFNIALANEYVRLTDGGNEVLQGYAREARFLRALAYWHALDLFRNVPFVTEEDGVGAFVPEQATPQELFNYIESELLAIEPDMADTGDPNYYARADKGAVRMLLAKLYLNAEVYTGTARWTEAATYAELVADDPNYSLEANFDDLFKADNNQSNEIVFHLYHDGNTSQSFGGVNMIIFGGIGGSMQPADFGVNAGWGGTRTTSAFVEKFENDNIDGGFLAENATDSRANLFTSGQNVDIVNIGNFQDGLAHTKFSNMTSTGSNGSNPSFVDTDFPMFRLADAYLMYAEAALRGGGSLTKALDYVNELQERAYGDASFNLSLVDLTLDFIIDERSREFVLECHRRTDLIRFGLFTTSDYVWPWKGGSPTGTSVSSIRNIYPIPSAEITANPNLTQNPGY